MSISKYFFTRSEHDNADRFAGKYVSSQPHGNEQAASGETEPLSRFVDRYWFVELPGGEHKALSTEEIADVLREGGTARSFSGPFSTRAEAAKSLERYWEMIIGCEDE
jgi:hypothetical protein